MKRSKVLSMVLALVMMLTLMSAMPCVAASDDEVIVPFGKYNWIGYFSDGVAMVTDSNGGRGYIDTTGKEVVPLGKYDVIYVFYDGMATVFNYTSEYTGEYGVIDTTGKEIVPCGKLDLVISTSPTLHSFSDGVAIIRRDSYYHLIDKTGKEIAQLGSMKDINSIAPFTDGMSIVTNYNGEFGVIDKTGKMVIPFGKYNSVSRFSDGVATAKNSNGKYGVIDTTGNIVVPFEKYSSIGLFADGVAIIQGYNRNEFGVIDKTGKEIIPFGVYSSIAESSSGGWVHFTGGMAIGFNMNSRNYDIIDYTGQAIPANYKDIGIFRDGHALVHDEAYRAGVIDKTGKEIIPIGRYDRIASVHQNGLAVVTVGGQVGVIKLPQIPTDPLDTASGWARDGITAAIDKGFVPTDLQGYYTNTITRQEFCRMAVKWLEYKIGKSIDTILSERGLTRNPDAFTDTSDPDILAAFALGITSGTGNNQFTPNGSFTREQAATMIRNTARAAGMDISNVADAGFKDIETASSWAVDGINYVRNAGIMSGTGNDNFSPKATYTREQSIITLNNISIDE